MGCVSRFVAYGEYTRGGTRWTGAAALMRGEGVFGAAIVAIAIVSSPLTCFEQAFA